MKFYVKSIISDNIAATPEGYLLCRNVKLAHTEDLVYSKGEHPFPDNVGDVTMKRSAEELFSDKTIASFQGKPITIEHPEDFVDPENWQELAMGTVQNVRRVKDDLVGDLLITVQEAIDKVNNGLREVSLGYNAMWELMDDEKTGEFKDIIGNHCALVEQGRAGEQYAILDHKKGISMDMTAKFKKYFGKSVEDAIAEKEKEDKESKDSDMEKVVKDLQKKVADLEKSMKPKEESEDEESDEPKPKETTKKEKEIEKDEKSKDADPVAECLAKIEAMLKKMMGGEEESEDDDDSEPVVADEDAEDEDADSVTDTMSRAEILAPGIKDGKDVKSKALEIAYKSTDGKKIIDQLTGGKGPTKQNADVVFHAASELLKSKRVEDLAVARVGKSAVDSFPSLKNFQVTPESINAANDKHYNKKQ